MLDNLYRGHKIVIVIVIVIPLRLVTSEIIVLTDSSSFHALRTQNAGEMRRWVFFTTAISLNF